MICAVIFAAVLLAMTGISALSFAKGNPSLLVPHQKYVDSHDVLREVGWFQSAVTDLKENVGIIIASVGLAFVLGLVWVELIKRLTKIIVYATIVVGIIVILAVSVFSIAKGQEDGTSFLKLSNPFITNFLGVLQSFYDLLFMNYQKKKKGSTSLTVFGALLGGMAVILMIAVFVLRNKIHLTCAIISETCRGIQSNYFGLISVSVTIALVYIGFAAVWGTSFVYLYSIPSSTVTIDSQVVQKFNESVRNLMYFQIFGFFWVSNFAIALFQMSVAGAMSQWYFTREDYSSIHLGSPAFKSFIHGLTYSFGSLAFGSLLVAIINFIQFLIAQARRASKTKFLSWAFCLVECCFGCIESLVKFINKFSFVYIAMHGYHFVKASRCSFSLLSRNFLSAAVVDYLTYYVLLIAKLLGTGISVLLCYTILTALGREVTSVTLTFVIVVSWLVFSLFSIIVDTGVDTIYVAYAEDLERSPNQVHIDPELHQELQNVVAEAKKSIN